MGANPTELITGVGTRTGAWSTPAGCLVLIFQLVDHREV